LTVVISACYCFRVFALIVAFLLTAGIEVVRWHCRPEARRLRMIRRIGKQP
jgi:hypothetical protein